MPELPSLSEQQLQGLKEALAADYSVEEEVGAGGMGIVYRARDLRHDRTVALKVLRPEIALSVGKERFLREVRIEAGLTHPHILPVFDSGEGGGLLYCVTPFIEGESLAVRLDREKQLPYGEALRICREIADALVFAHANDVIHRDVKPGNILLESGHAILADFGLAKAVSGGGDQSLTRTGFAVGTPAYSSPEQAGAEEGLDGRADLYSLGCVLYEMLAGQPPFVGPSSDSVVRQHLTAEATSVRIMRPAIPEGVEAILDQLLAKSPADRFSSAKELVRTLDAAISGEFPRGRVASKRSKPSWRRHLLPVAAVLALIGVGGYWILNNIGNTATSEAGLFDQRDMAVLYFEDLSPDAALQHVADGLTEGLITELSQVAELDVVSRNATAPFRGTSAPLDSVAEVLEVGTLIHGSVEQVGDQLRIYLRLVEGISGDAILRRSFDVAENEFLLAQDSVIHEVAWLLRESLGEEISLRRHQAGTSQVEAWALTRRGERELKDVDGMLALDDLDGAFSALGRADSLFALAEAADPTWAEPVTARGWIAYQESRLASDYEALEDGIARGLGHAERALATDPDFPRALELRGTIRYLRWFSNLTPDPEESAALLRGAREDLEAAVAADRTLAGAYSTLSHLYYQVSDLTNVLMSARQAYEADAYLDVADAILWRLFLASLDSELLPQARNWCSTGFQRFPDDYRFWECRIWELTFPTVTPNPDEAWRLQERTVELTPEPRRVLESHRTMIIVAGVLAHAAQPDSARSVLIQAEAGADVDLDHELPYLEAWVRTVLGDFDEAVALLATYFGGADTGDEGDGTDWANHWWWDDLRGHDGFQRLLDASR